MFTQPREGTEAHRVQKEVEKRKKLAKERGLDKLFSDAYHENIHGYPTWIKNGNQKYVYPKVQFVKEIKTTKEGNGIDNGDGGVELTIEGREYKITERAWYDYASDDRYNDLNLYLNGKKVFSICENVSSDEWGTSYHSWSVKGYLNEDWVTDFKNIISYRAEVDRAAAIARAEDPEKTAELKEAFGIELSEEDLPNESVPVQKKESPLKVWVWAIIIIILFALFSN